MTKKQTVFYILDEMFKSIYLQDYLYEPITINGHTQITVNYDGRIYKIESISDVILNGYISRQIQLREI